MTIGSQQNKIKAVRLVLDGVNKPKKRPSKGPALKRKTVALVTIVAAVVVVDVDVDVDVDDNDDDDCLSLKFQFKSLFPN